MSKWTFARNESAFQDEEFEELKLRARNCLIWRMSPEYYDSMSRKEMHAWLEAWQEIQDEQED